MKAQERWTILPYDGTLTDEARISFLRKQIKAMGLGDF
jgi:hypothetical protein